MNFELDDDQRLLKDATECYLRDQYGFAQRTAYAQEQRGFSPAVWKGFAELGLLAMPFAEEDGGLGMSSVEAMIVMEQFGKSLVLEPYLPAIILAGELLREAPVAMRTQIVKEVANGRLIPILAHQERASRYELDCVDVQARRMGGDFLIDGQKSLILNADCADWFIVSARVAEPSKGGSRVALFWVQAEEVDCRPYKTQDDRRAAELTFDGARGIILYEPAQAEAALRRAFDRAIAAVCAEAVGVMSVLIDLTVDHLKTRRQFGVPIGSFQSLQHRAAEMLMAYELARSMSYYAATMAGSDDCDLRTRSMHAAKVQIGRSAKFIGEQAVQLHGGIGLTNECAVGHYFKRLTMINVLFGDPSHHLARFAAAGGVL